MSAVWKHFTKDNEKKQVTCKKCPKVYKNIGSTTSSLLYHLRKVHHITIEVTDDEPTSSKSSETGPIAKYMKKGNLTSVEEVVCRCLAEDGMSANSFRKSKVIIDYFMKRGFTMPASNSTIWTHVQKFYELKKAEVIADLKKNKEANGRFSIVVDEWTDVSYLKYINVAVRWYDSKTSSFHVCNLGVEELKTRGTAENIRLSINDKLNEFGLNLNNDIVGSTHDGAAVMKKYGDDILAESQLCINHAIHLSVVD